MLRARQVDFAFPNLGYPIYDDPDEYDHNTNLFGRLGVTSTLFNGALTTELLIAKLQNELHYQNLFDAAGPDRGAGE